VACSTCRFAGFRPKPVVLNLVPRENEQRLRDALVQCGDAHAAVVGISETVWITIWRDPDIQ